MIVNPYYSTEQSYSEGIRVNRANNGWANIILGGDNGSSTGTSSTTWLIGHRGSNGTSSGSGGLNGANLTGKINDLTIEVNSSSGQGLTLPVAQGELLTWQQRPIMAQLPAQGDSATILNNANYKTAYLATTSNGNASMGLVSANWYHVMNFRHLNNNGFNSQFVLPLSHSGQAAWRLSSGTTWKPWNYIFDDNHAMIPASNNAYNIGSTSNYWATGYINTLYVAGNAYANGSKRIPTTGNTTGIIGSATVPVYSDNGVLKTITSYSGNAATATKLQTTRNIILNGNLQGSASFNGTGDATITALNYQSSVNGGNTCNYPWHRIATLVVGTGQYNDRTALLRIRHTFNTGGEGLVKVSVRTNSTGSGCNISAIWLYRYNIDANNIGIGLWGVTGDNVYLDVYYKYVGRWPRAIVESISNGRVFTLISSNEANDTTTTDKKTSSEVYTSIENGATLIRGKAYTKIVYGSDGVSNGKYVLKTGDTMSGHLNNDSEFITTSQNGFRISAASSTNTKSMLLRNDGSNFYILCCNSATAGNNWYTPTGGAYPLRIDLTTGYSYFSKVYGAVWNDYAEYRSTSKIKPGQCVIETGLGDLIQSTKRLQPGANIVSDTFGFAIGETEQTKTPIAVSGRVLAYPYEDRNSYQAGDPVCSGPNGTISKMTREEVREYPDRIIGTVSEIPDYEVWGTGNVKVNNRIWIKVK